MAEQRYVLVCVAPEQPAGGSFDDPDEAIVAVDSYWGSYYDVYDRETGDYLTPQCPEDIEAARRRLAAKSTSPTHDPEDRKVKDA